MKASYPTNSIQVLFLFPTCNSLITLRCNLNIHFSTKTTHASTAYRTTSFSALNLIQHKTLNYCRTKLLLKACAVKTILTAPNLVSLSGNALYHTLTK